MPNDELLTDDYVAGLLAQEANDCSIKYSAMGLEAFNTKNKPSNVPKPNTRFLRNIIKDTDSHNKALLAKEAAESKARLRDLERADEAKRRKANLSDGDVRRRQLGNIQSILGGSRHKRDDNTRSADENEKSRNRGDSDRHSRRTSHREKSPDSDLRKARRDYGRLSRSPERDGRRDHHEDRPRTSRKRHREDSEDRHRHGRHRHRDRSRSPRHRRRSRSPRTKKSKHRSRSPLTAEERLPRDSHAKTDGDDSDPLEEIIGPAPPPKYRGRGTVAGAASLDRRFSESYDPSTEVLPDDEEGGAWDDAVEAYRDRQKLRQMQEERMKAAGFADHQIQRANNSQREKTEEDVVWSKAGEERAWDRGKRDDEDGDGDIILRGILSEDS
ncbi:hypothetical protein A9Z42_0000660 [Trichoderma parareesei]|uniref:Pre-mRNA-splicing factor 38B n=1 Tax=Trichoderma parareesei TaxID=858221 RepID=A0A2H3A704_TRIPA|nr:hypothetical protein A9Z42_0000660 [Trichoderma parareesei]